MAMPAADVTAVCSAIPTSNMRSGHRLAKGRSPVGPAIAWFTDPAGNILAVMDQEGAAS